MNFSEIGKYGGKVLRPFKLRGEELKIDAIIQPEQFEKVPARNIIALQNAGRLKLFEEPLSNRAAPQPAAMQEPAKVVEPEAAVEETIPDVNPDVNPETEVPGINVGDKVFFIHKDKEYEGELTEVLPNDTFVVDVDGQGPIKVPVSIVQRKVKTLMEI